MERQTEVSLCCKDTLNSNFLLPFSEGREERFIMSVTLPNWVELRTGGSCPLWCCLDWKERVLPWIAARTCSPAQMKKWNLRLCMSSSASCRNISLPKIHHDLMLASPHLPWCLECNILDFIRRSGSDIGRQWSQGNYFELKSSKTQHHIMVKPPAEMKTDSLIYWSTGNQRNLSKRLLASTRWW